MDFSIEKIEAMFTLTEKVTVCIGDIKITPYLVSHSAYESFMFLIEVDNKRILHPAIFETTVTLEKDYYPQLRAIYKGLMF